MEKQLQELLENEVLGPEARTALQEAFAQKLKDAETQLQETYAQRFEHERSVLVEAMDNMLNDVVRKELEEFSQDKKALAAQRVKLAKSISEAKKGYQGKLKQHAQIMEKFMLQQINKELVEFREDRKQLAVQRKTMARELNESRNQSQQALETKIAKLETFVLKQLSEEIAEFHTDKKALVEQRVKLATESKQKLQEAQQAFVSRAANVVNKTLNEVIRSAMVEWRDDIKVARENNFGRKIFEAVAAEYMTSYLSEGSEVKKLGAQLKQQQAQLAEAQQQLAQQQTLLEGERKASQLARSQVQRIEILGELLSPLARDKRKIMESLLKDVKTTNLKESYHRYLPTVLNEQKMPAPKAQVAQPKTVAHSGDRVNLTEQQLPKEDIQDLQNILYLAGMAKAQ